MREGCTPKHLVPIVSCRRAIGDLIPLHAPSHTPQSPLPSDTLKVASFNRFISVLLHKLVVGVAHGQFFD